MYLVVLIMGNPEKVHPIWGDPHLKGCLGYRDFFQGIALVGLTDCDLGWDSIGISLMYFSTETCIVP